MYGRTIGILVALAVAGARIAGGAASVAAAPVASITAEQQEFFEKRVRPVLVERCTSCHGDKKQKAGLRLDSRAAFFMGSEEGPIVVPGNPQKSRLVEVIRYDGAVTMPPEKAGGKLPPEVIDALTTWVAMGAPWPAEVDAAGLARAAAWRNHWAFRPIGRPAVPAVQNTTWTRTPIDNFVLARLEKKEITPAAPADRHVLIRRASYDLTGLPPTAAEIKAFVDDPAPDAFAKVVDRMLASPRYGERWGRHWLDVARYADTKGYVFYEEAAFPFAYLYRDWVIKALNDDLPYDQFVIQQIAADQLLPESGDKHALAALGFLTLGRRFMNNVHDVIDDRIDVVARGIMGLTAACARCHDHKFDPIPTRDYYSLYGVFGNIREADVAIAPPTDPEYEKEFLAREKVYNDYIRVEWAALVDRVLAKLPEYLLRAQTMLAAPANNEFMVIDRSELHFKVLTRWRALFERTRKAHHPVMDPWNAMAGGPKRALPINPVLAAALAKSPPKTLEDLAKIYSQLIGEAHARWQTLVASGSRSERLPDAGWEELRRILYHEILPQRDPTDGGEFLLLAEPRTYEKHRRHMQVWMAEPNATKRAHVLFDAATIVAPRVLLRGSPANPGPVVPLQNLGFLSGISGVPGKPFVRGSGRLELGRAIATIDNPLTARVMVNRIWMHHFGTGLVRTPSDFGLRSEAPSHPDLLDWLARWFAEKEAEGAAWSQKKLHRLIMLSAVYQQASTDNAAAGALDPENRLLWRMPRQRLDFEAMRDSLLAVAGKLEGAVGGPSVKLDAEPFSQRRTLYGYVERDRLPGLYQAFDFATPDSHVPQRSTTTVPQQALFFMNNPFIIGQVRQLLARTDVAPAARPTRRMEDLYRLIYGRSPAPDEASLGLAFVRGQQLGRKEVEAAARTPTPWSYGYGALDECAGRLTSFVRFGTWTHDHGVPGWQAGAKMPDAQAGRARLDAGGGQPGEGRAQVVVRRWTAPRSGVVDIAGKLQQTGGERGNPVRARIIVGRRGVKGDWKGLPEKEKDVETSLKELAVAAGETVDFVVDSPTGSQFDAFTWAPVIKMKAAGGGAGTAASEPFEWSAAGDFRGPPPRPVTRWEELAQALVLSNEFMFVD